MKFAACLHKVQLWTGLHPDANGHCVAGGRQLFIENESSHTLLRVIGGVNWAGMVLYNVIVSLYNILHLK